MIMMFCMAKLFLRMNGNASLVDFDFGIRTTIAIVVTQSKTYSDDNIG